MLRKKNIIFLIIFFLLINNYLLAENNIYLFPKLKGRGNWQKEIHCFSSENQAIDLSFKAYSKNKSYPTHPIEIPLSFYNQGIFKIKEILNKNAIENISYLKDEIGQEKIIAFEVLKSSGRNKIEIVSTKGIENYRFRFPILYLDPDKYENFIILNENACSVKSDIYISAKRKNEIIFSKKITLTPSSSKYLQINELINLNDSNLSKGPISVEIFSDNLIKIFPVFGFYQETAFTENLNKEISDLSVYFPIIEIDNQKIWNIIFLYNNDNVPINIEAEAFDSLGNSKGIFCLGTIEPNKTYHIKSFDFGNELLFNSSSYVKIKTDKQITGFLIYGDEKENTIHLLEPFSFKDYSLRRRVKFESTDYDKSGKSIKCISSDPTIISGDVSNIDVYENFIYADLKIKNKKSIWFAKVKESYDSSAAGIGPKDSEECREEYGSELPAILASAGLISPREHEGGLVVYRGWFTKENQKITMWFNLNEESFVVEVMDLIFAILPFDLSVVKISNLYLDIIEIDCISNAVDCIKKYIKTQNIIQKFTLLWNASSSIAKLIIDKSQRDLFIDIIHMLLPKISKKTIGGKLKELEFLDIGAISLLFGRLKSKLVDAIFLYDWKKGSDIKIEFTFLLKPSKPSPIIASIKPKVVDEGYFKIEILGENFILESEVKRYSESDMRVKPLKVLSLQNNNKLIAGGYLPAGKYLIFVENPDNLESKMVSLTVRSQKENNIPNAPSNLRAKGISEREIELRWHDNSNNEEGFIIERKSENEFTWSSVRKLGASNTYYRDDLLFPNAKYYYKIKAYNSYGDSSYSNEASAKTKPISSPPPSINYISPSIIKKGEFVIEIYGNNFDNNCSVKVYYEPDGHFVGYLQITNWTSKKIMAKGKIDYEGNYIIVVRNSDTQESNKIRLVVGKETGNEAPVARFEMSSQGKTAYENETLSLTVEEGEKATVNFSASRSSDSDGSIESYEWKIGGSQVSSSRDFSFDLDRGTHAIYLTVTDDDGSTDSVIGTLVIQSASAPTISSISPSTAKKGQTHTFQLTGTGFQSGFTAKLINELGQVFDITQKTFVSSTQVKVTVFLGSGPTSTQHIKIINPDGQSAQIAFTAEGDETQVPEITSISPSSRPYPAGTFDLTIYGSNFDSGAVDMVYTPSGSYMGSGVIKSQSSTQIVVTESMEDTAPGNYTVKVKNSDGTLSNGKTLVVQSASAPTISSISPSTAKKGQLHTFTLTGTGFQSGFTAKLINELGQEFNITQKTFVSSTQVKVTVFLGSGPTSTQHIKIINPDGQSAQIAFTAEGDETQVPEITSISPSSRPYPAGTFDLTIYGSNFDSGAVDMVYTPSGSYMGSGVIKSQSSTQIVVTESMEDTAPGNYTVKVKNSDGTLSNGKTLVVQSASAPTISSISPSTAKKGQLHTFTLTGTGFQSGFTAKLINELGQEFNISQRNYISSTQVKVTVYLGSGPTSTQYIKIINPDDQSAQIAFTAEGDETQVPEITSISPSSRPYPAGTFDLTIYGSNFDSGAVDMVYTPSGSYMGSGVIKSRTATKIVVTESMENSAPGNYTVKVKNSDGTLSNGKTLVVQSASAPTISSISPSTAKKGQLHTFTLTGTGFQSGFTAKLINELGQEFNISQRNYISSTQVKVTVYLGSGPTSTQYIKIINPDDQSAQIAFTAEGDETQVPEITSISPSSRPYPAGTFDLTIYGSNFDSGAVDMVYTPSGSYMGSGVIKSQSSTQIVVTESMENSAPGNYTVKVKNSDGTLSNGKTLVVQSASAPTISSISPSTAKKGQLHTFTLTGTGFQSGFTAKLINELGQEFNILLL